jgi:hypothetical protein
MKLMIRVTIFTLIVWHNVNVAQGLKCHGSLLPRASFARRCVLWGAVGNSMSLSKAIEDRVEVHSSHVMAPMIKKLGDLEGSFGNKLGEMHSDMVLFKEQINEFQALKSGIGLIFAIIIALSQFLGDEDKHQLVRWLFSNQMVLMGSAASAALVGYFVFARAVKNMARNKGAHIDKE